MFHVKHQCAAGVMFAFSLDLICGGEQVHAAEIYLSVLGIKHWEIHHRQKLQTYLLFIR